MLSTELHGYYRYLLFHGAEHWDWNAALMAGAILSATDPVAIVALLKELGVSERLTTLMEGASSLSDGTTFVIFQVGVIHVQNIYTLLLCQSIHGE